jgi:lipopolysaccharide transport system permease protein
MSSSVAASLEPDLEIISAPAVACVPLPHVVIRPIRRWSAIDFRELWEYRGLFGFLVWKDIKVRYAQTIMGAGWAILQPVLTMLVFTVIFGKFAKIASDGVPYWLFSFAALVPWTYFSHALTSSSNSLIHSTNLITKVYFPRLIIPCAPVLAGLVDFSIAFTVLLLMMLGSGFLPSASGLVLIPILLLIAMMTATGIGCWLSALNIQYRDVKHVTPFLVQLLMYGSPVVYGLSSIPDAYRPFYLLNPMVGVVEGFRSVLLGTGSITPMILLTSAVVALALCLSGALYFRRTEKIFADVA